MGRRRRRARVGAGSREPQRSGLASGYLISGFGYPNGGLIGDAPPPRRPTGVWKDLRVAGIVIGTVAVFIAAVLVLTHI